MTCCVLVCDCVVSPARSLLERLDIGERDAVGVDGADAQGIFSQPECRMEVLRSRADVPNRRILCLVITVFMKESENEAQKAPTLTISSRISEG